MKTQFLLFVSVSGALSAQSAVDVPFHAAATECNESLALPFGYEAFRTQLLVDPAAISPSPSSANASQAIPEPSSPRK